MDDVSAVRLSDFIKIETRRQVDLMFADDKIHVVGQGASFPTVYRHLSVFDTRP